MAFRNNKVRRLLRRRRLSERGQTLTEYALLIGLMSIGLVAALQGFGLALGDYYDGLISDFIDAVTP